MSDQHNGGWTSNDVWNLTKNYGVPILGGACVVGAIPVLLYGFGFTGCGIAAGTLAPKVMAWSAVANGGGVASGGFVATLQSAGAAGLGIGTKFAVFTTSVGFAAMFSEDAQKRTLIVWTNKNKMEN